MAFNEYFTTVAEYNRAQFLLFHAMGYPAREIAPNQAPRRDRAGRHGSACIPARRGEWAAPSHALKRTRFTVTVRPNHPWRA